MNTLMPWTKDKPLFNESAAALRAVMDRQEARGVRIGKAAVTQVTGRTLEEIMTLAGELSNAEMLELLDFLKGTIDDVASECFACGTPNAVYVEETVV